MHKEYAATHILGFVTSGVLGWIDITALGQVVVNAVAWGVVGVAVQFAADYFKNKNSKNQ